MTIEETSILLKDGRAAVLRSPLEDDAEEMLQFIIKASEETEFLMKYICGFYPGAGERLPSEHRQ